MARTMVPEVQVPMGDALEREAGWKAIREAMARGDALGWLRGRLRAPAAPEALFASLGAERRALVAELRRRPGADDAVAEVEAFFDAVHAAAAAATRPGAAGPVVWPWPDAPRAQAPAVPQGALALLHDTGQRLLAELDLKRLLPLLVERAGALTRADVALLAIWDPGHGRLVVHESRGVPAEASRELLPPPDALAALGRSPGARLVPLAEAPWLAAGLAGTGLGAALVAPLGHGDAPWGLLVCGVAAEGPGDDVRMDLASVLAGQMAIAVRNAALYREALEAAEALQDANERLRGLDVLKDHFLATVSHELRTPLTWITGFGSLLVEEPELAEAHRYYVQKMLEGAFQLLGLVNDLLDYSRMKEGRLPLHREPFDPAEVARALLAQHEPVARRSGLILEEDVSADLPLLHGDRERVGQVLGNLLANALKFTPPGGRVALRVGAGTGPIPAVRFEVADTGPGVRPEDQGRLFERFGQLEVDPARRLPGTGLGLAISRGLVEAHGGEIGLVSPVPGTPRGSCFWFELPLGEPPA